jgi:hypothetical protein
MYPTRYQLPELTDQVLAALERRREGFATWNAKAESALTDAAREVLREAGVQFAEVADDKAYWQWVEQTVLTVALPRYFLLAKEQSALEAKKYGLWRGGDLVSRAAYAALGLVSAAIVWRTGLPKVLEPLPFGLFIGGPLLPDLQVWFARRRYANKRRALVVDMEQEAARRSEYQPLFTPPSDVSAPDAHAPPNKTKEGA